MKHFWSIAPPFVALLALGLIVLAGCERESNVTYPTIETSIGGTIIRGQVVDDEGGVASNLLIISKDSKEIYGSSAEDGTFELEVDDQPQIVVAVAFHKTGYCDTPTKDGCWIIELKPVQVQTYRLLGTTGEYWWGVYDTDSHGDVRFRYRYNFSRFYCSSWLPGWPFGDPNPNHWTSWDLTDFPYPWKGKKLLVPQRYQWWHHYAYGYSISQALYLVSWL